MKFRCTVLIIISFWLSFVPTSNSANLAQNICEYIAIDDKGRLRKLLKTNRLKLRTVFHDVKCDNKNLLIFSASKKASRIGKLLIKKLPKDIIKIELDNLAKLSPSLADLAKTRIN
ncbi:DUF3718 domain-containing protein [Cognaticolwellia mytili]|uniref:DUF3718 domain-containing protein n=1 Tax=Cognaticolwellia mytili TaxID=1888913 RepID=UPI000A16E99F|nr:DUF3718 domain-containing protein [Cognaticolwellia mytili]